MAVFASLPGVPIRNKPKLQKGFSLKEEELLSHDDKETLGSTKGADCGRFFSRDFSNQGGFSSIWNDAWDGFKLSSSPDADDPIHTTA